MERVPGEGGEFRAPQQRVDFEGDFGQAPDLKGFSKEFETTPTEDGIVRGHGKLEDFGTPELTWDNTSEEVDAFLDKKVKPLVEPKDEHLGEEIKATYEAHHRDEDSEAETGEDLDEVA